MLVWNVLKRLRFKQLVGLTLLALKYPLYLYPTLKATSFSFRLAKKLFPETHGKKGKGNALRHAIWNTMICFYCYNWRKDMDRVNAWAKIITDKHEQLFPNKELDTIMDLHNNRIGREIFKKNSFTSADEVISTIQEKLKVAEKVDTIENYNKNSQEMIYIEDER